MILIISWRNLLIFPCAFFLNSLCMQEGLITVEIQMFKISYIDLRITPYSLIIYFSIQMQGTIPKGNFTDENVKGLGLKAGDVVVRCTRCECIKTDRAHHCSTCQRCIRKMDHHCPW